MHQLNTLITQTSFITCSFFACQESKCIYKPWAQTQKPFSIKPPLCVYSSTPPGQSWAGWPVLGQQWTGRGCWSVGHGGAGQSERSRGSRSGGSAWRSGRLSDLARNSPPSRPPGRCSLLVPHRSCRGWWHSQMYPIDSGNKLEPNMPRQTLSVMNPSFHGELKVIISSVPS